MDNIALSGGGKVIDVSNTGLYAVSKHPTFTFKSGTNIIGTSASSIIQKSGTSSNTILTCNKDIFLSLGCVFTMTAGDNGYYVNYSSPLSLYINSLSFTISPYYGNSGTQYGFPSISLPLPAGTTIKTSGGSSLYFNCSLSLLV